MDLNHLRIFYEVAKAGKFSEAAARLSISQSALSRSVALLEAREKVTLFERSKTGVTLTAKGERIFRQCEELFRSEREIENLCREVEEKCEGPLCFAASDHVINDLLVEPIHEFRRQYPGVIFSISSGTPDQIVDALSNTDREFGLLFSKINTPQIEFRKQHLEPMALVCHPDIWKECKSGSNEKTLQRVLKTYGYICSIGVLLEGRSSRVIREVFGDAPKIGVETNSQEAQKRFALAGEGIAYLARFMVKKEIERCELFEIPLEHAHNFDLWFAKRKGHQMSLAARTFLNHLKIHV